MFNDATSLLFYVANLQNFVLKVRGVNSVNVMTACPPGLSTLEDYNYLRSIHLTLKFVVNYETDVFDNATSVYYMTFRYTLPYSKPSTFSSIEIFDKGYNSVQKFKVQPTQLFFDYINEFELGFKNILQNHIVATPVVVPTTMVPAHD